MSPFLPILVWRLRPFAIGKRLWRKRIKLMGSFGRNFFIKLFHWEYWPFGIIQLPLMFMWLWYSLRERSFFYFSASNPGILSGGMMGESKFDVLSLLPEEVKPRTLLI